MDAKTAATKFSESIVGIFSTVLGMARKSPRPEETGDVWIMALEKVRDHLAAFLKVDLMTAANMARLYASAALKQATGMTGYSAEELEIIKSRINL